MKRRPRRLTRRRRNRPDDPMAAYEQLSARARRLIERGRYEEAMRLLLERPPPGPQAARV